MSLSRTVLLFIVFVLVSPFYQGRLFAQSSPPVFVKVNPAGTYLAVDPCDLGTPPTSVTLTSLGIVPGDFVRLTRAGAFKAGVAFNDNQTTLGAVFRGPAGFISPGPDGQHVVFNSLSTACSTISTDIAEDFNAAPETVVQVPVGATEILFTGNDSFYSDNTDPNGDYGVWLEFGSSWPILVTTTADSGAGSLRDAITVANNDPAPNSITFDPNVFPPTTPCVSPLLPLPPLPHSFVSRAPVAATAAPGTIFPTSPFPNILGDGDSIDGTGACVVIDGTNLPFDTGLRIRAKNVRIQALTIQNFVGNDGVRVEARNNAPKVTGVVISGNNFYMDRRAVNVNGGTTSQLKSVRFTVEATVTGNMIQDVQNGITVVGNIEGDPAPGNDVTALVDNNVIEATFTPIAGSLGDGINVLGAVGDKSDNIINATISNNTVRDVIDDGIAAGACGRNDTGSNNTVNVTITGNTLAHFVSNGRNQTAPDGIVNNGIVVYGSGGESSATSACTDNTIRFLVATNTVNKFPNAGITISGGDEQTSGNDLQGDVLDNVAQNSPGNPTTTTVGGNGIQISGGSGMGNRIHDVNVCGNKSSGNFNRGIGIFGGSGTGNAINNINICGNSARNNGSDGIGILGSGNGGIDNEVTNVDITANQLSGNDDGIFISAGPSGSSTNGLTASVNIFGNSSSRNRRDGIRVSRGDATSSVLLSGISANAFSQNGRDGIGISSNVNGAGNTPITGNFCDDNGQSAVGDGIDIDSDGYALANNSCSRNTNGDGINAEGTGIGGNLDNGGNRARRNGACNEPGFCF